MTTNDAAWLRREGERLIAKGRAMVDRAANLEADGAMGGDGRMATQPGRTTGLGELAREMAAEGWITAQALAEAAGVSVRHANSSLSRLTGKGVLQTRKTPGYPSEYTVQYGGARSDAHG